MSDQNPNSLELHPKSKVFKYSKRPVILVVMGLLVIGAIMASGIHKDRSSPPPPPKMPQTDNDNNPLLGSDGAGSGLVAPAPKESPAPAPQDKADVPLVTQPQSRQRPVDPMLRQELEQIRRYKMQMQLQALQAPLSVGTASASGRGRDPQAQRAVYNDPGSARDDVLSRHPVSGQQSDYNPADRKDKEDFLNSRSVAGDAWTLPHTRTAGAFCEIKTGTVIPGIMLSGVNSDLPGKLVAQVSQNVYDTASGNMLIIPQGSRLFGVYDSRIAMGQARVLIAWNRILFPDGSSVDLGTMPGADSAGYSGFNDQVDNHYFRIFGSAFLMSLISGGMSYSLDALRPESSGNSTNQNPSVQDQMGTALASQMGQASLQLLQKNINIQPTLEIRPGYRFNLVVIKDVVFDAPYKAVR